MEIKKGDKVQATLIGEVIFAVNGMATVRFVKRHGESTLVATRVFHEEDLIKVPQKRKGKK